MLFSILWQTILIFAPGFVTVTNSRNTPDCGVVLGRSFRPRIFGGEIARTGSWPWLVAIKIKNEDNTIEIICSGTLLNEEWVLTAAHCTEKTHDYPGIPAEAFLLVLGKNDLSVSEEGEITVGVSKYVVHEGYVSVPGPTANDIALFQLKKPVDIDANQHINVICLSDKYPLKEGQKCFTAGWGSIDFYGTRTELLQQALVTISDQEFCKFLNELLRPIDHRTFCAGSVTSGGCKGDSGSPLVCQMDGRWYAVGVTSGGLAACSFEQIPTVYTKIEPYMDWIKRNIQRNVLH